MYVFVFGLSVAVALTSLQIFLTQAEEHPQKLLGTFSATMSLFVC